MRFRRAARAVAGRRLCRGPRREPDLVGRVAEVDDDAKAPAGGDDRPAGAGGRLEDLDLLAGAVRVRLLEVGGERNLGAEVHAGTTLDEAHVVAAVEGEGAALGGRVVAADDDRRAARRLALVGGDGPHGRALLLRAP